MRGGEIALEFKEISVRRGAKLVSPSSKQYTLSGLSAYALKGELVALIGDSGVGKSTLLRLIAGLESLQEGTILRDGFKHRTAISSIAPETLNIGYVPQESLLFPHLSVSENIAFSLRGSSLERVQAVVTDSLDFVELLNFAERKVHHLSGGQRRRVALARGLVRVLFGDADVLLLDEPLNSLEPRLQMRILTRLSKLCERFKILIIWSTHMIESALRYSHRIWALESSEALHHGRPLRLYHEPPSRAVAHLLGEVSWVRSSVLSTMNQAWMRLIAQSADRYEQANEFEIGLRPISWAILTSLNLNENRTLTNRPRYIIRGRVISLQSVIDGDYVTVKLSTKPSEESVHETENLPNSFLIRMKLTKQIELKANQEVNAQYLGEPLVYPLDEEPS